MIAEPLTHEEQRLRDLIISEPANIDARLLYADYLLDVGRPEAAARVRETSRIRPEPYTRIMDGNVEWVLWQYTVNCETPAAWLVDAIGRESIDLRTWPTEQLGMRAILEAITHEP